MDYKGVGDLEEDKPSDAPWTQRWFGSLTAGGYRSSLLTLCSSMIGVGFLTLPEIGKNSGLYPMVGLILTAAFISCFANWQIGRGFRATGGKTYSKIVARVDGRTSSLINMVFLLLYVYVSAGAYYVFGAQFAWSVVTKMDWKPDWIKNENEFSDYFILVFFVICFLGSLPSKIAALRYFTFITAVINLLLGALLIYQIPSLRSYYQDSPSAARYETAKFDLNLFSSYCLSLFSSVNQFSVVNVLSEFQKPTARRVNKLVFYSPIIPMIVYLSVAIGGYQTCGSQCNQIIINRDTPADWKDLPMNIFKLALLVCLVVGIIIRNQSNKAAWFGIIDQFKKINNEAEGELVINDKGVSEDQLSANGSQAQTNGNENMQLSEELNKASSVVLQQEIDTTPFMTIFIVQLLNSMVPAITAILAKENLIEYVEAGSGFLAPVFIIIYPCLITIRLHQKGVAPVSPTMYIFIWAYLIFASIASYSALVINFLVNFKFIKV